MVDTTVRAGFVKGDVQLMVPNQFQISSGTVGFLTVWNLFLERDWKQVFILWIGGSSWSPQRTHF